MLENLQKLVGFLILFFIIIFYIWLFFFKEDVPRTGDSPYARDRFIEIGKDTDRMNREAQNLARDARYHTPKQ